MNNKRLDYRKNLIVDVDNPILIQKAWRDRFSRQSHWKAGYGGEAYLSRKYGEDALTWNVFRSLQKMGKNGINAIKDIFSISEVCHILFWGCDVEHSSEVQQLLNCSIRGIDGRHGGTMTESDLVIITEKEVVFVECKLNRNGRQSPWKAQGSGAEKRFNTYIEELDFRELRQIDKWQEVYQLLRQYIYSKTLANELKKKPLVIPLINKNHLDGWSDFYQPLREFNPEIFRPFVTWQEICVQVKELGYNHIEKKISEALEEARGK